MTYGVKHQVNIFGFLWFSHTNTRRWLHMQSRFWSFVVRAVDMSHEQHRSVSTVLSLCIAARAENTSARLTTWDKPKTMPFYNAKPGATMAGLIKSPGRKRSFSMYKSKHRIHYPLPQNFSHSRSTPVDFFIRRSHRGGLMGSRCEPWSRL